MYIHLINDGGIRAAGDENHGKSNCTKRGEKERERDTHAAFTYGTLLKRCGMKTSTRRSAPADGARHCMLSMLDVMFKLFHCFRLVFFYLKSLMFVLFFVLFAFGFIKTVIVASALEYFGNVIR